MSGQEQPSAVDRLKNILSIALGATALITWVIGDIPRVVRLALAALAAAALLYAFGPRRFRAMLAGIPVLLLLVLALVPVTRAWILPSSDGPPEARHPLSVDVIAEPGTFLQSSPYDPWWLFPGDDPDPSGLAPPSDELAFHRWAAEHDGVPAHHSMFRIVLRGKSQDAVLVTGLRVRVVERSQPLPGWFTGGGGCGVVPIRWANIDLDTTPPTVEFFGTGDTQDPSTTLTLELRRGQPPEVIEVFASTDDYHVAWYVELVYQVEGQPERSIRIDDDGEPFQVTAVTEESRAFIRTLSAGGTSALQREPRLDGDTSVC